MKSEYDFSKAERGKFYRKDAELRLPIYLDASVQTRLERVAELWRGHRGNGQSTPTERVGPD